MPTSTPKRRADAERNIETILRSTHELMAQGALPSMSEVASASGIGRVTLYSHFPSREVLLEEVLRRAIAHTDEVLTALELEEESPPAALGRMVQKTWPILDRHRRVRTLALAEIGPEALRRQHDAAFQHVGQLIERGRATGDFRTDQPVDWLVATFYAILHAAADEVDAGRLASDDAPALLTETLLATLRP